jgi:Uma2 family endonuclease
MSVAAPPAALPPPSGPLRGLTVAEYHHLIETGYLTDEDKVELLNGFLVHKMPRNPPHDAAINAFTELLPGLIPSGWTLRVQSAITLTQSEPEPDLTVVRGAWRDYRSRHPIPAEIGLVIEVADTSHARDRNDKAPIYAAAGLPVYWIVNLVDRQIEVYTKPAGTGSNARYASRQDFRSGDLLPFALDGTVIGQIAIQDVLP